MSSLRIIISLLTLTLSTGLYGQVEVVSTKGMGQTTGHIITLSVRNNGNQISTIAPAVYYIPSDNRYQSYVGRINDPVRIPPGGTADIPVDGYCADISLPPLPENKAAPDFEDWILIDDAAPAGSGDSNTPESGINPGRDDVVIGDPGESAWVTLPEGSVRLDPGRTVPPHPVGSVPRRYPDRPDAPDNGYTFPTPETEYEHSFNDSLSQDTSYYSPGTGSMEPFLVYPEYTPEPLRLMPLTPRSGREPSASDALESSIGPLPTWPGTSTYVPGIISPETAPEAIAPLYVSILELIEEQAIDMQNSGNIQTPFSSNPDREIEALIQHTFWLATSLLTGKTYTKEQFADNVYAQFQQNTGLNPAGLPEEQKDQLDGGVDDFWGSFQAVGVEAKVFSQPEEVPIQNPEEELLPTCTESFSYDTTAGFDIDIAEGFGDAAWRQETTQEASRAFYQSGTVNSDLIFREGSDKLPAGTQAFSNAGTVGGFGSAYAHTYFSGNNPGSGYWRETKQVESTAQSESNFSMTLTPSEDCSSLVVGVSLARVKAGGTEFDAVGHDPNGLAFLRGSTWLGKQAVSYLLLRKAGRVDGSFADYVKDNATDEVRGEIQGNIEEAAEDVMNQIFNELGLEPDPLYEFLEVMQDPMGALEEALGIDIPSLEDLEAWIDEGVDAAFGLAFVSSTYAQAFGDIRIYVGRDSGYARAHTTKLYARVGLEESEDAVRSHPDACDQAIAADAQPGSLSIISRGFARMSAAAKGNGHAKTKLWSLRLDILIGLCFCDGEVYVSPRSTFNMGGDFESGDMTSFDLARNQLTEEAGAHLQGLFDTPGNGFDANSDPDRWANALANFVADWAGEGANRVLMTGCQNRD